MTNIITGITICNHVGEHMTFSFGSGDADLCKISINYLNGDRGDFNTESKTLKEIFPLLLPPDAWELRLMDAKLKDAQDEIFRLRNEYQKINLERIQFENTLRELRRAFQNIPEMTSTENKVK
jgi:hypothetical protein